MPAGGDVVGQSVIVLGRSSGMLCLCFTPSSSSLHDWQWRSCITAPDCGAAGADPCSAGAAGVAASVGVGAAGSDGFCTAAADANAHGDEFEEGKNAVFAVFFGGGCGGSNNVGC